VFSPDGTLVVTTSIDTDGRVWNAHTGAPLHVLGAHFAPVRDAAFSPDGHWIVTAGPSAARLWFAATGAAGKYLFGSRYPLRSAAFSPDSRRIVTAGADGAIRIYRCETCGTPAQLEALARRRLVQLGRSLSPAQRKKYLGQG
jgi:WD40 repeat protein